MRRDLKVLGVLEASGSAIDELLKIAPADMTNEQLDVAVAFCRRQLALWGRTGVKGIDPVPIEASVSS